MGIDQDSLPQRALLRTMVIDDDHVDSHGAEIGDLRMGICAAVERDEQVRTVLLERAVDGAPRQPVAILGAPGHHEARLQAEAAKHGHDEGRGGHPVHIVIAEDDHLLVAHDRLLDPRRGGGHARHEKGIRKPRQHGFQERNGARRLPHAGAQEQFGEDQADPRPLAQRLDLSGRKGRVDPAHRLRSFRGLAGPCPFVFRGDVGVRLDVLPVALVPIVEHLGCLEYGREGAGHDAHQERE